MKHAHLLMAICFFNLAAMAQVNLSNPPYQENFDNLSGGLPTGFFVQTGSTPNAAGTDATFTPTSTLWNNRNQGFYNCASATGLKPTSFPTEQNQSTNRALSVRQTASFGNPGATFVFKIANTNNKTNFQLNFRMVSLDSTCQAISIWAVDYGFGANPTSFTALTTSPTPIRTGAVSTNPNSGFKFFTDATANFGTALDNKSDIVWIRIWTPAPTIVFPLSNSLPTMSGIDDWSLNWTNSTSTSVSLLQENHSSVDVNGMLSSGVQVRFNESAATPTNLQLISADGRVVWNRQIGQVRAGQTEFINPNELNNGLYILSIRQKEKVFTKKLMK